MKAPLLLLLAALAFGTRAAAQHLMPAVIGTLAGERIGYKDESGAVIIKPLYEAGEEFSRGLARVRLAGRYGLIDTTGQIIVPLKYKDLGYFYDGLAGASLDGVHYGYINRANAVAIPFRYQRSTDFSEGTAVVALNDRCLLIDKRGTVLTPAPSKYLLIEPMQGGIARVVTRDDNREGLAESHHYGFIDAKGRALCAPTNYGPDSPNLGNGRAVACVATPDGRPTARRGTAPNGTRYTLLLGQGYTYRSMLLDKTGRVIIPASAGYTFGNWGDDYVIVKRGDLIGAVDMAGKLLLPVGFRDISKFEYGPPGQPLARVTTTADGKFFYVDQHWQPTEYDGVKPPEY